MLVYLQSLPGALPSNDPHPADTLLRTMVKILRSLLHSGGELDAAPTDSDWDVLGVSNGELNVEMLVGCPAWADRFETQYTLSPSSTYIDADPVYCVDVTGTIASNFAEDDSGNVRVRWSNGLGRVSAWATPKEWIIPS
jgi:hypothetical protein